MKNPLLISGLLWTSLNLSSHALDRDGDGMCDIWEARHAVGALAPDEDADGNGISNLDESIAGTNPFQASSRFGVEEITTTSEAVVKIASVPGKSYRLLAAPTPSGPWTPVGSAMNATGADLTFPSQPSGQDSIFFRVSVQDTDSDGDGLSDWAERQLEGYDPIDSDSFGIGQANSDLALAEAWLDSLASAELGVTSSVADAYEKENAPAVFTISRPAPLDRPFTVFMRPAPPSSSSVGLAGTADFQLKDASGANLTDRLVIPAGQASAEISIHPLADSAVEVPEEVRFNIGGSSAQIAGRVCDAMPTEGNVKLLVAYLSPRPGVSSLGSGMAAARLAGDNASAVITVSFTNLGSIANSAHVETPGGATMISIPPFRYNGQTWNLKATQYFTQDQQVLDALLSGDFLFNVSSEMEAAGEIAGAFQSVTGSTEFQEPPPAEPIVTVSGDDLDREIVRFLTQATYGARWEDVVAMRTRVTAHGGNRLAAFEAWIDEQFALPAPSHQSMTAAGNALEKSTNPSATLYQNHRQIAWWTVAMTSPDQLRQRMTYALSQIFVISDQEPLIRRMAVGVANYYDMLQSHNFGSYRDLLEDVTLHPNMGHYLSHLRNQKTTVVNGVTVASPDENFAREIMQLFSIGLVKLHPDGSLVLGSDGLPVPTYDQNDITELAKVFTGWSFSKKSSTVGSTTFVDNNDFNLSSGYEEYAGRYIHPMKLFPDYHDEEEKSFLGLEIPARVNGGLADLDDTLDFLAAHPNTAPFISRLLIQRFTTANPSAGYLHRVSTAFAESDGNLGTTVKAILLDPEARNLALANSGVGSGKAKEPLIRHASLLRATGAQSSVPLVLLHNFGYPTTESSKFQSTAMMARYRNTTQDLVQNPVGAPSVFNWYRPDFAPAGSLSENGVYSPEFQLVNETTVVKAINYHYSPIYSSSGQSTTNLPTGLNITGVPNFASYNDNSDNMMIDFTTLRNLYLSVLDTDGSGSFSNADTTWNNRATKVPEAIGLVVDRLDLLLCAGSMKARYGDTAGKPRRIILDAVESIRSSSNNSTSASTQTTSMNDRIKAALYLVAKSPDFIIQK